MHNAAAKLQEAARVMLQALGLSTVFHFIRSMRHWTGRGLPEPTKIAIRQNRTIALLRSSIHILPLGVCLGEIVLNWNVYYVGSQVYNQAVYQFLAKVHEFAIQASLAAILFSYVRHELSLGEGIPFGSLFSALQVSQISYLWSMEFWGTIRSGHCSLRKKMYLLTMIAVILVLAASSGPSSAVLLIPRLSFWPAGKTSIWVNITSEDLWPSRLDDSNVDRSCATAQSNTYGNACPSSEWERIYGFLHQMGQMLPQEYIDRYRIATSQNTMEFTGKSSLRRFYYGRDDSSAGKGRVPVYATIQHAAIADALTTAAQLWFLSLQNITAIAGHGSPLSDQLDALHTIKSGYYQPYSTVDCLDDTIQNASDSSTINLPWLTLANDPSLANSKLTTQSILSGSLRDDPAIVVPDFPKSQLLDTPGPVSEYRLRWLDLPESEFNGSSLGLVVLSPRPEGQVWQNISVCSISAAWGKTLLQYQTHDGGDPSKEPDVTSQVQIQKGTFPYPQPKSIRNTVAPVAQRGNEPRIQYHLPFYPQRPIKITKEWAEYLNPHEPRLNTTIFNILMTGKLPFPTQPALTAKAALLMLVTNGLARTGYNSQIQGTLRTRITQDGSTSLDGNYWVSGKGDVFAVDPEESKDWVKLQMESELQGYAYNADSTAPLVAIGMSSTCWDSIAEVTALAVNSSPSAALRNTCAGITELHIFKLPVRILAMTDEEGEGEHLELVFGNVDEGKLETNTIKPNRTYGTMPRPVKRESKVGDRSLQALQSESAMMSKDA
ncbi:MAG: hypothetical protein Q9207_004430 [Kuettlingeria erythrocarpa]